MKRTIGCLALLAILYSCAKDVPSHSSYQAGIPFTTVSTPDSVAVKDTIVINVHCETQTNGGSVDFLGFQVIENPIHTFNVTAVAFFDFYGTSSGTKDWKFDKSLGIPTIDTGRYIMKYYNDNTLFQTDTCKVK